jgi:integrase
MYPVLFGLIAATGIRISEALSLRSSDIAEDGLIIRQSKLRKSRLVPLHLTTQQALRAYLSIREALATSHDNLFVLNSGKVLTIEAADYTFRTLVRSIGLTSVPDRPNPRIHDLRHSFAVRSLERCLPDGTAVARHIVALSTYLGHVHVRHTYWYLQATPLLMTQIADAGEALHQGVAL